MVKTIFETGGPPGKIFCGNILLIGCCIFYILWWILAFKPTGAIKGISSGWLLIPAFILGAAALVMIIRGINEADMGASFFAAKAVVMAGLFLYIALFLVTWFGFHRQVTTELFLIVGWAVLAFLESNTLYGLGIATRNGAVIFFAAAVIAAALSMICYMLYYSLDARSGYVDGMIPLIIVAVYMAALNVLIVRTGG